jgi:hypothetical protein
MIETASNLKADVDTTFFNFMNVTDGIGLGVLICFRMSEMFILEARLLLYICKHSQTCVWVKAALAY